MKKIFFVLFISHVMAIYAIHAMENKNNTGKFSVFNNLEQNIFQALQARKGSPDFSSDQESLISMVAEGKSPLVIGLKKENPNPDSIVLKIFQKINYPALNSNNVLSLDILNNIMIPKEMDGKQKANYQELSFWITILDKVFDVFLSDQTNLSVTNPIVGYTSIKGINEQLKNYVVTILETIGEQDLQEKVALIQ